MIFFFFFFTKHDLIHTEHKVAFGATLGSTGDFGPFNTPVTLVYDNVYVNEGGAYNPTTGMYSYNLYQGLIITLKTTFCQNEQCNYLKDHCLLNYYRYLHSTCKRGLFLQFLWT